MQHVSKGNKTEGFVTTNILGMPNTLRENIRPSALFLRSFLRRCFAIVPLRSPKRPQARRGSGNIAQLVEHSTENAGVVGSIPTVATKKACSIAREVFFIVPETEYGTEQADRFLSLVKRIEKVVGPTIEPTHLSCRRESVAKFLFLATRVVLVLGRPFFVAAGCQFRGRVWRGWLQLYSSYALSPASCAGFG